MELPEFASITPSEMPYIIERICVEQNEPVMIVGGFGGGKTEIGYQTCAKNDWFMCDVRLGQYQSVDLHGFPDKEAGWMHWCPPKTLPFVGNDAYPDDKIVLLTFDEITSAEREVFGVAYQIVNERRIGEFPLKDNVRILCMGNREIDRGIVNRMPMPLNNRMTWFELSVSVDNWCVEMERRGVDPMIIAFIQWKKEMLHTFDPDVPRKVVATPRTWWKASKYWMSDLPERFKTAAIMGAIGRGPATEFQAFVAVYKSITPVSEIIKNPLGVRIPEPHEDNGALYATSVAVARAMTKQNAGPLHKYLKRLAPEYTVTAWTLAAKRDKSLWETAEYLDMARVYQAVFTG
jgi:hypothetical protein